MIGELWWLPGVFCLYSVLFEHSSKLRETATEQKRLQAAYNNLKSLFPVTIFGPTNPFFIRGVCVGIKERWLGQMTCSNMVADRKKEKYWDIT